MTGKLQSDLAREIGCHRSTICREVKRNSNAKGEYNWRGAQSYMKSRRRHIVEYPRKISGSLEELVRQFLEIGLSPEQISSRLRLEESRWSVSHETVYKWIYKVAPDYKKCLRWRSRRRQKRVGRSRRGLHKLPRKLIDARPIAANLRSEAGHWERDLLEGRRPGPALLVLQDRCTRMTLVRKVNSKSSTEVSEKTVEALRGQCVRSITNDNGVEFGKPQELEKALGVPIYFCHAYASWERGTVENTNGLLRQFYPKHTDFSEVADEDVVALESTINLRPKKILGYRAPAEVHEGKALKLIRSERFYRESSWMREDLSFKEAMRRETGFYLDEN